MRSFIDIMESAQPLDLVVYHGTANSFDHFESGHSNGMTRSRLGFYFTDDADAAVEFGTVRQYRIRLSNPAVFADWDDGSDIIREVFAKYPETFEKVIEFITQRHGDIDANLAYRMNRTGNLQTDDFIKALIGLGYDGMVIDDSFAGHEFTSYVVFNATNIERLS